jgi:hypothetical protein
MTIRDLVKTLAQAIMLLALLFSGIWMMALLETPARALKKDVGNSITDFIEWREVVRDREHTRHSQE